MSKTVRVSDELYEAIDDYRRKDQPFQEVLEEMAEEFGILPANIKDLNDLENKLAGLYGYNSEEINCAVEALQRIYIGQEKEGTIGIPHADVDPEYADEVDTLKRLGLVKENHYTGKYDYGYRTTAIGDKIASEQVRRYIDEYDDQIQSRFNDYSDTDLSILLNLGFVTTETGHLTTRGADLSRGSGDPLLDSERIHRLFQEFKEDLSEIGIAVKHSNSHFTVLPPEFADYLQTLQPDQIDVIRQVELYQAIKTYAEDDINTRQEILQQLETTTEDDLADVVNDLHDDELTSHYVKRDEAPFLIKETDELFDHLRQNLKEEFPNESSRAD